MKSVKTSKGISVRLGSGVRVVRDMRDRDQSKNIIRQRREISNFVRNGKKHSVNVKKTKNDYKLM